MKTVTKLADYNEWLKYTEPVEEKSELETLFNTIESSDPEQFKSLVSLLGNIAEVESYRGVNNSNPDSTAAGAFHFIDDAFATAKRRVSNLMRMDKYKDVIAANPKLVTKLNDIQAANSVEDLDVADQAILAFVDLKMKGNGLNKFLGGKKSAFGVYRDNWATTTKKQTAGILKRNWDNAQTRLNASDLTNLEFLTLRSPITSGTHQALPRPIPSTTNSVESYKSGGILSGVKKIPNDMKDLIQPYITSSSKYSQKSGNVTGLTKPDGFKAEGVSFGANKDGFFVYTHRARSKSHKDPFKITEKEKSFIKSTG